MERAAVICIGFNHHHSSTSPASWNNKPRPPRAAPDGDAELTGNEDEADEDEAPEDQPFDTGEYNPDGRRVWSWLVLCDDGTFPS